MFLESLGDGTQAGDAVLGLQTALTLRVDLGLCGLELCAQGLDALGQVVRERGLLLDQGNREGAAGMEALAGEVVARRSFGILQVAFIGALDPATLSSSGGWANLAFKNDFGPLAALATILGMGWLAILLYVDAIVSPGDTGLIYTTSSSRVS